MWYSTNNMNKEKIGEFNTEGLLQALDHTENQEKLEGMSLVAAEEMRSRLLNTPVNKKQGYSTTQALPPNDKPSNKVKIYLAGGFKSGWQDRVISTYPQFEYLDPRSHGLTNPDAYTAWDLAAIKACDIVFAYLEKDNPGGYALALEIGYAKALDKIIILVNEKPANRYLDMVNACADDVFLTFEYGLKCLGAANYVESSGEGHLMAMGCTIANVKGVAQVEFV